MGTGNAMPVPPNQGTTGPQPPQPTADDRLPNEVGASQQQPLLSPDDNRVEPVEELLPLDGEIVPPAPQTTEPPLQPPPATAEEVDFDAIMTRFKNDPRELARSWLHAQQKITEQQTQIAQQVQPPAAAQPASVQQPPQPQQQPPPAYSAEREYINNPGAFSISDRGFPINPNTGQEFLPLDQFGVPFTPETRWQAVRAELNEAYPDNAVEAIHEYNRRVQSEQMWRSQQHGVAFQQIDTNQAKVADDYTPQMVANLAAYFPQEIAQEMVTHFRQIADNAMRQYRASGQPLEQDAWRPDAIAQAMNLAYFQAFNSGQLLPLAEQARARLATRIPPKGNVQPQQPTARLAGQVLPPPTGNNGASPSRPLTAGTRRLVEGGVLKADEVDRYLKDDFDFDGD